MLSKYLQQYYTLKCLTRDLLSNIIFSQNSDLPMLNIFDMAGMGKRRGVEGREKIENEMSTNMLCGICICFTSYFYSTKQSCMIMDANHPNGKNLNLPLWFGCMGLLWQIAH